MVGCTAPTIFKVLKIYGILLVHTVYVYRMVCLAYTFTSGSQIGEESKEKTSINVRLSAVQRGDGE